MNEPQPERDLYRPYEKYRMTVEGILTHLFDMPDSVAQDDRLAVPAGVQYRSWGKDGVHYLAVRYALDQSFAPLGMRASHMTLLRVAPATEGLSEIRSYQYSRTNGDLQVASSLFTPEEFASLYYQSFEANKFRQGLEEGLEQRIFTASDVDYLDFLTDLDSFKDSSSS